MTYHMGLNETLITLDGYVDVEKHRALYVVILCAAFVVIICSNGTIVCLIWIHKNLHEPMYIFIAALLLNSLIFSSVFYPKILIDIVSERQVVTYLMCLVQLYVLYTVGGAELWLLMVMAFDRYLATCKPLQYHSIMTKFRVNMLLVVAWAVPACQLSALFAASQRKLCSFTFSGIVCNSTIYKLHCVQFTVLKIWAVFSMINMIFFPVIFTCFTYIRIFIIANKRGLEARKKAMRTCLPHLIVLFNFVSIGLFDVLLRLDGELPKTGRFIMTLQTFLYPLYNPFIYGLNMKKISAHLKIFLVDKHVQWFGIRLSFKSDAVKTDLRE